MIEETPDPAYQYTDDDSGCLLYWPTKPPETPVEPPKPSAEGLGRVAALTQRQWGL